MEDSVTTKVQSPASVDAGKSSSKLLRYPLRSSMKSKEENHPSTDSTNSSVSKRGRPTSNVSKSVAVLDFSGKEKSAKPPRRLSVPSKSSASTAPRSVGNITPISEARVKRSAANQGKSPVSDVSLSSSRRKFCILSSSSYWLSQIKLSESASKHKISLGFFELALEAGCEPLQKIRDELKSYVSRYDLSELGESVNELFEIYKISENFQQLQASNIGPLVPEEGNQLPDDDVHSSTFSITDAEKLKPNPSDTDADEIHGEQESNKETSKKDESVNRIKRSVKKDVTNLKSSSEVRGRNSTQKNPKKPTKQELAKDQDKLKKQGKKYSAGEGPIPSSPEKTLQENKENLAVPQIEISATEE
ncbi:muscle M-line assembly protein unc-89-like isoform X2 [Olea europaea var. sylvestris]|uniref:Uncharacterized protein n=1 Tax=Olea europaea subsp. europaea TaxID=158383 RepID=A0A8S0VE10_OLEEU|nr:muscle M-line assembly protein unc-89-like isoform X2 [Olea europaea var. sylvestris]CAA3030095.1 Hypothetical predicted protein [Olea europaea subsp. europaea]